MISYLPTKSGQPVEPGWPGRHTPPRRAPGAGLGGERRSPSLRFFRGAIVPSPSGALYRAKPRPGLRNTRRGLASYAALRRESERRRGARGGVFHAPFFVESLVKSCRPLVRRVSPLFPLVRGISSARSASAQTAVIQEDKSRGERSECHELNRLGSPQRRRSPAIPEIGDDSCPAAADFPSGAR